MKSIDARNQACPKPVLMTKNAIADKSLKEIEVIVDNIAAKENVTRFLEKFGFTVETIGEKPEFHVKGMRKAEAENFEKDFDVNEYPCPVPQKSSKNKTVFINSEFLGRGDDDLGRLLMKAFIYTLNEVDNMPERILFMNSGVKLCIEDALTLENIQKLSSKGVDILVCGTCLDFFKLTDKLKVGKISNMYDIAGHLTADMNVITI